MHTLLRIGLWMGIAVSGGCGGGGAPGGGGGSATGVLDAEFNGTGKVTTPVGPGNDYGRSMAIQADGRILVAGYSDNGANDDFAVVRYDANGSLDPSFGAGGRVTTAVGLGIDRASGLALQPDGKIVVAGESSDGTDYDFAVVRYLANGSLDPSFGMGGQVTTPVGLGTDRASGLALQSDGKIVVAGYSFNGTDYDFAVVRYLADGSLDPSFGMGGQATTAVGPGIDVGNAVALQPDGKIVVAGYSSNGTNNDYAVVRYLANGSPDPSFGMGGRVTTAIGPGNDLGNAVAIQADGRIIVAGSSSNGANDDFAIVRYYENGSLDPSFADNGCAKTDIALEFDGALALALQSDGKIVAAGWSDDDSNRSFCVARYDANGSLDSTFNGIGHLTTDLGTGKEGAFALAIQLDGKIVAAGYARNGASQDFAVVRYR